MSQHDGSDMETVQLSSCVVPVIEHAVCINLRRRPDRWLKFNPYCDLLPAIERLSAVDGTQCRPPKCWEASAGCWGCYRSHERALEICLSGDWETFGVFEDDAVFLPGFRSGLLELMQERPDWDMLWLGGNGPRNILGASELITSSTRLTHAILYRRNAAKAVYGSLIDRGYRNPWHVDAVIAEAVVRLGLRAYRPKKWLVGQAAGLSDISQVEEPFRH